MGGNPQANRGPLVPGSQRLLINGSVKALLFVPMKHNGRVSFPLKPPRVSFGINTLFCA
jgi:hypothetical protein